MLERRQDAQRTTDDVQGSYLRSSHLEFDHQWLVDAVELLLRIELERQA